MRGNSESARLRSPGHAERKLESAALNQDLFRQAQSAFRQEDYHTSLDLVQEALDQVTGGHLEPFTVVPEPAAPRVKDGVVLWANNLYQLDRYDELEVLMASAGRWGLIPDQMPELDVVLLHFAIKRGQYHQVVEETSQFINANRLELPPVIADYLYLRGMARSHLGEPTPALDDAEAAFSLFKVLGRDLQCARSANLMGILSFRSSRFVDAAKWFGKAFEMHKLLGMRKNMGGNLLNLGIACYKRGQFTQALNDIEMAEIHLESVDARPSLCRVALAKGYTLRLLRNFPEAQESLLAAFNLANELQLAREETLALEYLGDVARDQNQIENARRYYSRALAVGRSIAPDGDLVMEVMRRQGQCLILLGRESESLQVLNRALGLARNQDDRFEEGVIRRAMAEALFAMGDQESAYRHTAQSVALLEKVGARHELAKVRLVRARIGLARMESGLVFNREEALEESWEQALSAMDIFLETAVEHWTLAARQLLDAISALRAEVKQAAGEGRLVPEIVTPMSAGQASPIIHVSSLMRDIIQMTDAFADSSEPVLITGATGTGKELFARRIHEKSGRRSAEMVSVNATAIPESVFAREFFGHVKGSFSGADQDGIGLAAKAHRGTLFLDEIGEMPLSLQPRLLRLLQDGTYHALGDPTEQKVDIRLVAATNADLEQMVARGTFRADLYYRLKILELKLPPLVQRKEDVIPLLRHFLSQGMDRPVQPSEYFCGRSLELIQRYDWPGNVREIAMVASQAKVQMAGRGRVNIELGSFDSDTLLLTDPQQAAGDGEVALEREMNSDPRTSILMALAVADGNRAKAALDLGVSRSTLYRRMEKLGIL